MKSTITLILNCFDFTRIDFLGFSNSLNTYSWNELLNYLNINDAV